jgi:cytochrome c peroxidase
MASSARQFARVATRSLATAPRQALRQQGRRFYSSEPEKKSNSLLYLGLAAATGGLGIWFFTSGASASSSFVPTQADYQKVYNDIASRLEVEDYDDGSYGPVLVRLAWHASGTYDKETKTGGSNGATMRFAPESGHGANAGLIAARDFLEPIKGEYLSRIPCWFRAQR